MPSRVRLNSPAGIRGIWPNVVPEERNGEWIAYRFGDYGERVLRALRAVASSELGCNVIVDDLLFKRAYLDDYVDVLNAEKLGLSG